MITDSRRAKSTLAFAETVPQALMSDRVPLLFVIVRDMIVDRRLMESLTWREEHSAAVAL